MVFICAIIPNHAFAFNREECEKGIEKYSWGFLGTMISMGQTTSSTGGCSLFKKAGNPRLEFIKHNFENIKIECSRGGGEFIQAYAQLSGCAPKTVPLIAKAFHDNFTFIFGQLAENNPELVYKKIDAVINTDKVLALGCKIP